MDEELKYENMIEVVFRRIPAFRDVPWANEHDGLPHVAFGNFASFLKDLITKVPLSDPTIQASFELLNEMASSRDWRVSNLAKTGVFEVLLDSPQSIAVARQLLFGRAIDDFEDMVTSWGTEVKDP